MTKYVMWFFIILLLIVLGAFFGLVYTLPIESFKDYFVVFAAAIMVLFTILNIIGAYKNLKALKELERR